MRRRERSKSLDLTGVKTFLKKLHPLWVKFRPVAPFVLIALASFIIGFSFKKLIPVAIVNGDTVSRSEFNDLLVKRAGRTVMQEIIINDVIKQEVKDRNVKIEKAEINKQMEIIERDLKEQNYTLEKYLAQQGISEKDLRKQVQTQLIIKRMFEPTTNVTEKEIQQFYKDNGIVVGKNAILRSQRVAIRQAILQFKMREAYNKWLLAELKNAEVTYLIRL
jgi:parvulin-like peptidyl-prolyl isomerase